MTSKGVPGQGAVKLFLSVLLLLAVVVDLKAQGAPEKTPFEMVRSLQSLQAQVAQGNSHALAAQRALLLKMDDAFLLMDKDTWQDARNARAAVIHLLSGGHPKVIRALMALDPAPAIETEIMRGALAYVEGRESDALTHLESIKPLDVAPNLGGQLALVKAALMLRTNPKAAGRVLSVARLLVPGSLVEEAALRREVFVAGMLGDIERFQALSIRYLRRFRGSIYAGDFRRRFALAIDVLGFGESPEKFAILESLLSEFDGDTQRSLYLRLARTALLSGNLGIVEKATAKAMPLAMQGTRESELFKLYRAGALINIENIKETRDLLWSIDIDQLEPEERKLMYAVYSVMNNVRHFPDPPPGVIGEFDVYADMGPAEQKDWVSETMNDAEYVLNSSEAILKQAEGN